MAPIVNQLEQEFAQDHRNLTRGFSGIIAALQRNEWTEAVRMANQLNREGGGHIAFEEKVLYPRIAQTRGQEYVRGLYDEHRAAMDALRELIQHPDPAQASDTLRQTLIEKLQTGLDHAVSCGTLLSHLTVLDDRGQRQMLDELRKHRIEGKTMLEIKLQQ